MTANVPWFLSVPYLGYVWDDDRVYQRARAMMLIEESGMWYFNGWQTSVAPAARLAAHVRRPHWPDRALALLHPNSALGLVIHPRRCVPRRSGLHMADEHDDAHADLRRRDPPLPWAP